MDDVYLFLLHGLPLPLFCSKEQVWPCLRFRGQSSPLSHPAIRREEIVRGLGGLCINYTYNSCILAEFNESAIVEPELNVNVFSVNKGS